MISDTKQTGAALMMVGATAVTSVVVMNASIETRSPNLLPHGLVTPASHGLDRFEIDNLDDATRTRDCTSRLYSNGCLRDRRAANPEHLSQKLVRKHDRVALDSVTGFQQPPAEPRLEPMQGVTRRGDPRLCKQILAAAQTEVGNCFT
jgi:hypothetical protein